VRFGDRVARAVKEPDDLWTGPLWPCCVLHLGQFLRREGRPYRILRLRTPPRLLFKPLQLRLHPPQLLFDRQILSAESFPLQHRNGVVAVLDRSERALVLVLLTKLSVLGAGGVGVDAVVVPEGGAGGADVVCEDGGGRGFGRAAGAAEEDRFEAGVEGGGGVVADYCVFGGELAHFDLLVCARAWLGW